MNYDKEFLYDWLLDKYNLPENYTSCLKKQKWIFITDDGGYCCLWLRKEYDKSDIQGTLIGEVSVTPQILDMVKNEDFNFLDVAVKKGRSELRKIEIEKDFM